VVDTAPYIPQPLETRLHVFSKESGSDITRWLLELQEGFNLIFYGYGSQIDLLDAFESRCSEYGDVIRLKHLHLGTLLRLLNEISGQGDGATALLSSLEDRPYPTFIVLDSLDGAGVQSRADNEFFSRISQSPAIRIITTMIKRDTMLSSTLQLGRGRKRQGGELTSTLTSAQGSNWLWHDATTFLPYRSELKGRNLLVPPHAERSRPGKSGYARGSLISQVAAEHILVSVTDRARNLFKIIAKKQLAQMEEWKSNGKQSKAAAAAAPSYAVSYMVAYASAQELFLATGHSQMKTLLSEFTDHGLIQLGTDPSDGGGDVLWIAMSPESLQQAVQASSA